MNTAYLIAKKLSGNQSGQFSKPIVKIAIASVSIGLAVMIIALAVINGFQTEVQNKIIGFGSHIQIQKFDNNTSLESVPISANQPFITVLDTMQNIHHIQVFATKAGLIKSGEDIQGVIFKGISNDYQWDFLSDKMISGKPLHFSSDSTSVDVIISKSISKMLHIQQNDDFRMFFLVENSPQPRGRKFHVAGIYETGIEELDQLYVIGDIRHIRKLNNWDADQISGFEITLKDFSKLDKSTEDIEQQTPYDLEVLSIKDIYPQIFDWLDLQDINIIIIIVLMVMVSGITMISTLLIIILEKTNTIGILKALGSTSKIIRRIFLIIAGKIVCYGMLFGNIIGIGLALLQQHTGLLRLPQEAYYMTTVPILINPLEIILINIGTFIICILMMWAPAYFITKKSTIKIIAYN